MKNNELLEKLDTLLDPSSFSDAAHNGMQIEGKPNIQRVICGVSANDTLIQKAVDAGADAIFVHHGFLWKPGVMKISGFIRKRLAKLLRHDINVFAYHLPLDAHAIYGNNAGLFKALELQNSAPFGDYRGQLIGCSGKWGAEKSVDEVVELISDKIGAPNFVFGGGKKSIQKIAICSGGAADLFEQAVDQDFDLYLTGEASEWTRGMAEELGVSFIAAGHHATERFGARAIAGYLADELGLDAQFVDVPNPV